MPGRQHRRRTDPRRRPRPIFNPANATFLCTTLPALWRVEEGAYSTHSTYSAYRIYFTYNAYSTYSTYSTCNAYSAD